MNSLTPISPRTIALTSDRPRGYQSADEVRNRAAVTNATESPHERRALTRLDKALDAKRPPQTDVPRGYYLDIRV
ncbi:MAG: hypothetical protein ACTSV1_01740 [Alphaproteobacteria bacterium]